MKVQIKQIYKVTDEMIEYLFISACEGGSNYWCSAVTPKGKDKDAYKAMFDGFTVIDATTQKKTKVTKAMIKAAITNFGKNEPLHFMDMINGTDDATTGDVFLQLCVFGKVIYG